MEMSVRVDGMVRGTVRRIRAMLESSEQFVLVDERSSWVLDELGDVYQHPSPTESWQNQVDCNLVRFRIVPRQSVGWDKEALQRLLELLRLDLSALGLEPKSWCRFQSFEFEGQLRMHVGWLGFEEPIGAARLEVMAEINDEQEPHPEALVQGKRSFTCTVELGRSIVVELYPNIEAAQQHDEEHWGIPMPQTPTL